LHPLQPFKVIISSTGRCDNCDAINRSRDYNPPLLSPRNNKSKCINCEEVSVVLEYEYESAVIMRLRDEDVFKDVEIGVILFSNNALDIGYGETVIVTGDIHVIQMHGPHSKLVSYLYSKTISSEYKKEIIPTEEDVRAFQRFVNLPDRPENYPKLLDRLVSMFAPNMVGGDSKKLALLRS